MTGFEFVISVDQCYNRLKRQKWEEEQDFLFFFCLIERIFSWMENF